MPITHPPTHSQLKMVTVTLEGALQVFVVAITVGKTQTTDLAVVVAVAAVVVAGVVMLLVLLVLLLLLLLPPLP